MRHHCLRDDQWDRIKDALPGRAGSVGMTAADNRRFVDAVLYRYRTGIPWCQWRREIPQNRRAEIPHFILIQSRPNPFGGLISARVSRSRSMIS
jgi:transposase